MSANSYPLRSVYLYFTQWCNLKCRHCWINPAHQGETASRPPEIDIDAVIRALEEARRAGMRSVKLTGGEAFLRKDVFELFAWFRKTGTRCGIETNGTLIGEKEARAIAGANVSHVAVSLDGPEAATHERLRNVPGSFEQALTGIRMLKEHVPGAHLQVIFSLWRGNRDRLAEMISFARGLGVNTLKINVISCISRGETMHGQGEVLGVEEVIAQYNKVASFEEQDRKGFRLIFDIPAAFKPLRGMPKLGNYCGLKGILGILGDGTISLCGIGNVIPALSMGNIRDTSVAEVWKNDPVLQRIRADIPSKLEGICGRCISKGMCLGKCRAEAYWKTGSLFAPFSFCQQAYERGLFPATRMIPEQ